MLKQVQHDGMNQVQYDSVGQVLHDSISQVLHNGAGQWSGGVEKKGYVYLMTNDSNTVLYIGVTSDLDKRVKEHKNHFYKGFTDKYNCTKLVYFEECNDIESAIVREKQLKNWHRNWKKNLVDKFNNQWKDLAAE